jgi:hypothetical protein
VKALAALALPLALVSACSQDDRGGARESSGATSQAVVGGTADATRPDVLLLRDDTLAGFRCTATLLAPNLVITARHCVGKRSTGSTLCRGGPTDEGAQSLPNYEGDADAAPMYFSAAPGSPLLARGKAVYDDGASTTCAHDVALIELDRALTDITPAQLRRTPLGVGDELTAMGFGWTDRNATVNATERMKAATTVLALGPTVLSFKPFGDAAMSSVPLAVAAGEIGVDGITMTGDSGGPAFDAAGRVAALVSRGYGDAYFGPGTFTVVAAHLATIDRAMAATGNGASADAGGDGSPAPPPPGGGTPGASDAETDAGAAPPTDGSSADKGGCTAGGRGGSFGFSPLLALALALAARRRRLAGSP